MPAHLLRSLCGLVPAAMMIVVSGCCAPEQCAPARTVAVTRDPCFTPTALTADMPPNARPGECYAKVFIPARTKTVTERVCIRPASERIEVVPAEYEWVEERVCVKEASKQLEVTPAEFASAEQTVLVEPCHTDWRMQKGANCVSTDKQPVSDVFCLVKTDAVYKTVATERLVKPACVREVTVPAEFTTVRRQKLKCAAHTRKVAVPAEFANVEKTIVTEGGRMEWQRVICEERASADTINDLKKSLASMGYQTGEANGRLEPRDWTSLKDFQAKSGIGVGALTYATFDKLGVSLR